MMPESKFYIYKVTHGFDSHHWEDPEGFPPLEEVKYLIFAFPSQAMPPEFGGK